jgi:hypothetical protein
MNLENAIKASVSFIEFKEFVETINESVDSLINKLAIFVFKNAHMVNDQFLNLIKEEKFKNFESLSDADRKTIHSIETAFKVIFVVAATLSTVKILQIVGPLMFMTKAGYDFYKDLDKTTPNSTTSVNLMELGKNLQNILPSLTITGNESKPSGIMDSKKTIEIVDETTTDGHLEQAWRKPESDEQSVDIEAKASDKMTLTRTWEQATRDQTMQKKMDYVWSSPLLAVENSFLSGTDTDNPELEEIWSKKTHKDLAVTAERRLTSAERKIAALTAHLTNHRVAINHSRL